MYISSCFGDHIITERAVYSVVYHREANNKTKNGRTLHLRLSINPFHETNALSDRVLGLFYG